MSKNSIKKFMVCIIAILMVLFLVSKTFASENILDALRTDANNSLINTDETPQEIPEGTTTNTNPTPNTLPNNALENTKVNTPTETPNLGLGDYSTYIFIGIFAISAIYAYKKVRDYKA